MAYGGSKPPGPKLDIRMDDILPRYSTLKDGTPIIIQRLVHPGALARPGTAVSSKNDPRYFCTEEATIKSAELLLNDEIAHRQNSYPFESVLTPEGFLDYFLGHDTFVVRALKLTGAAAARHAAIARTYESYHESGPKGDGLPPPPVPLPDHLFVAAFYVKPNYPGRSAHLCNGGFLVSHAYRSLGAGELCGAAYRVLARRLGYRGSVFNLVFSDNPGSARLWDKLGFVRVGVIPGAGRRNMPRKKGNNNINNSSSSNNDNNSGGGGAPRVANITNITAERNVVADGVLDSGSDVHHVDATVFYCDLTVEPPVHVTPWERRDEAVIAQLTTQRPLPPQSFTQSNL